MSSRVSIGQRRLIVGLREGLESSELGEGQSRVSSTESERGVERDGRRMRGAKLRRNSFPPAHRWKRESSVHWFHVIQRWAHIRRI